MALLSQIVSLVVAVGLGFVFGVLFERRREKRRMSVALQKCKEKLIKGQENIPFRSKFQVYDAIEAEREADARPKDAPVLPTVKL